MPVVDCRLSTVDLLDSAAVSSDRPTSKQDTPMFRQYRAAKAKYADAIVLFRMGDFYEMFFDDALVAAPLLGIA